MIVCGVYFLFKDGNLSYIGQSKNCHQRIEAHRKNGREFDMATVMPLQPQALVEVESALIRALNPEKNVTHTRRAMREMGPHVTILASLPVTSRPSAKASQASGLGLISRMGAKKLASSKGVPGKAVDRAWDGFALARLPYAGRVVAYARRNEVEEFLSVEQAKMLVAIGLPPLDTFAAETKPDVALLLPAHSALPSGEGR